MGVAVWRLFHILLLFSHDSLKLQPLGTYVEPQSSYACHIGFFFLLFFKNTACQFHKRTHTVHSNSLVSHTQSKDNSKPAYVEAIRDYKLTDASASKYQ